MYNVLIVEDDPMARKLMEIFVSSNENYQLVPEKVLRPLAGLDKDDRITL